MSGTRGHAWLSAILSLALLNTQLGRTSAALQHVYSDAQFQQALEAAGDALVVADFWSLLCISCQTMAGVVQSLVTQYPQVTFLSANIGSVPETARTYSVFIAPSYVLLKDDQVVKRVVGPDIAALMQGVQENAGAASSSD